MEDAVDPKAKQKFYAIEDGNRYYVAVAVLEYDPGAIGMNPEKEKGVADVRNMFKKALMTSPLPAADVTAEFSQIGPLNTNPFAI